MDYLENNLVLSPKMEAIVLNNWDYLVSSWAMLENRQAMLDCKMDSLVSMVRLVNMMLNNQDLPLDILGLLVSN